MQKVKIVVAGAAGRMGHAVIEYGLNDPRIDVIGGLDVLKNGRGLQDPVCGVPVASDLSIVREADVLIDFTMPSAAMINLKSAIACKRAIVIGTTGFTKQQISRIRRAARTIPVCFSPNMSTGVNLLFKLAGLTAKVLEGYDMEIVEVHHNRKADAPSGTAVKLAAVLADAAGYGNLCYGRKGRVGARQKKEIGIHAVRAGDIVGEHTVIFAGPGERIELVHRAHSRTTFAAGAVRAARWLKRKKPGLYDMRRVLSL